MSARDIVQAAAGVGGGGGVGALYLLVGGGSQLSMYEYSDTTGIGAQLTSPSTSPPSVSGIELSKTGAHVIVASSSSPYLASYEVTASGLGAKVFDAGTLSSTDVRSIRISMSASKDVAILGGYYAPIKAVPYSESTGFGAVYSDPTTPASGFGYDVHAHPSGVSVAAASTTAPYINVYEWDDTTGFGAKYADATGGVLYYFGTRFSPDGSAILIGSSRSPYMLLYPWSNSTGFGTRFSNPTTLPANKNSTVRFSPTEGVAFGLGTAASASVNAYKYDSSTGFTSDRYQAVPPTAAGNFGGSYGMDVSPSGLSVSMSYFDSAGSSRIACFPWDSSTGFGTYTTDMSASPITISISAIKIISL